MLYKSKEKSVEVESGKDLSKNARIFLQLFETFKYFFAFS